MSTPPSTTPSGPLARRSTLRGKAFALLAASLGGALVLAYVTLWALGQTSPALLSARGASLASLAGQSQAVRKALADGDAAALRDFVRELKAGFPELSHVIVLNAEEAVVAELLPGGIDGPTLRKIHQGKSQLPLSLSRLSLHAQAISAESAAQQKPLGRVLLGVSPHGELARQSALTLALLAATSLFVGLSFALFFARLTARLRRLTQFAARMAAGDLLVETQRDDASDELALLATALQELAVRTGGMVGRLQSAASALARASSEIFSSTSKQGDTATRQAAAVSETGATVAELRQTFQQASERAQAVIDLAKRSEESTSGGKHAVEESVTAMQQIRDQVLTISRTMVDLVERTNQIGIIIDAVNDLAEQSNVLALNAAIEAAKAGEQGRGFAVVAREVRSLAERSKDSTSQVRTILQDIERASREALGVMEEGTRKTQIGMDLAERAGQSIGLLDRAISESSTAAKQIAASTRQQAVGVEQIWQAMRDIDKAVNESASGIRQLETASRNMKDLSDQMAQLVSQYRVEREPAALD